MIAIENVLGFDQEHAEEIASQVLKSIAMGISLVGGQDSGGASDGGRSPAWSLQCI